MITLTDAIRILLNKHPGRFVIGYWKRDGVYILNTKPMKALEGLTAPGQYIVTEDGEVYGTNPIRSNLDISEMKKI